MKEILKVAIYSLAGIFRKKYNQKARDIIISWESKKLKRYFAFISIFYITVTSILLYLLSEIL
jgi:hypothetical protein